MSERKGFMKRFEYIPGQHRPKTIRNGVIFLAIVSMLCYMAYAGSPPFWPQGGKEYKAEFERADYIRSGVQVRVAGVQVGEVTKVERRDGADGALITFRITDEDVQLCENASTALYWRTLLGFFYEFELDPGDCDTPVSEGFTIPEKQSVTQVSTDEVLRPLDDSGQEAFRGFIKEVGEGFEGDAPAKAIDKAGPATKQIAPAVDALSGERRGDLARLVDRTGEAMEAIGRQENALGSLVSDGAATVAAIERQRTALGQMIDEGPETMAETQATMVRLRTTLDKLDPVATELRPGARALEGAATSAEAAVEEARPLLKKADPLFADLKLAVRALGNASGPGKRVAKNLEEPAERINDEVIPELNVEDPATGLKNGNAIGPFFAATAGIASQYSFKGHQVHFGVGVGPNTVLSYTPCSVNLGPTPSVDALLICSAFDDYIASIIPSTSPRSGSELVSDGKGSGEISNEIGARITGGLADTALGELEDLTADWGKGGKR